MFAMEMVQDAHPPCKSVHSTHHVKERALIAAALTIDGAGGVEQRFNQRGLALAAMTRDGNIADVLGSVVFH